MRLIWISFKKKKKKKERKRKEEKIKTNLNKERKRDNLKTFCFLGFARGSPRSVLLAFSQS
jgi:hypothetical protein